jgi:hypothetical protein
MGLGFEKGYVRVQQTGRGPNGEEFYDYDEMAATFKVRYMTAMEAYLRLNSYKIVNMSHQIYTLSVHDELGQTIVLEEGNEEEAEGRITKDTKLTAFFKLCDADASARELTYDRLPYKYRYFFSHTTNQKYNNEISFTVGTKRRGVGENVQLTESSRRTRKKPKCSCAFIQSRRKGLNFTRLGILFAI